MTKRKAPASNVSGRKKKAPKKKKTPTCPTSIPDTRSKRAKLKTKKEIKEAKFKEAVQKRLLKAMPSEMMVNSDIFVERFGKDSKVVADFVEHYVMSFNISQSVIFAGIDTKVEGDFENQRPFAIGKGLLSTDVVWTEIQRLVKLRMERMDILPLDILMEFKRIAFSDISQMLEWGVEEVDETHRDTKGEFVTQKVKRNFVRMKTPDELTIDQTRCIKRLKLSKDGSIDIALYDKVDSLTKLAGYFDLIKSAEEDSPAGVDYPDQEALVPFIDIMISDSVEELEDFTNV